MKRMKQHQKPTDEQPREPNLLSNRELAVIKQKLALPHRTEADWIPVKELLKDHDLIVIEPAQKTKAYRAFRHILWYSGCFLAFTSIAESRRFITELNQKYGYMIFKISSASISDLMDLSDACDTPLVIDWNDSGTMLLYQNGRLRASILTKV